MEKKVLIHSIAFSPDGVSTAYLYNDIAKGLQGNGYEVVVLTTTPHYNVVKEAIEKQKLKKRFFGLYYVSDFQGIKVYHVYQHKFKNILLRMIGFVFWHVFSILLGLSIRKISFIISPSPPLTIGLVSIIIGKIKRAKVVYNVQEIYPDLLIDQGVTKNKLILKTLEKLEKMVYNHSDAVVTIDEIFYNIIKPRFKDVSKLSIIPNFVDSELYRPISQYADDLDKQFFPETDSLKVMYAGNIGYAQDWKTLLGVAEDLKSHPIEFFVIGEGVLKQQLIEDIEKRDLKNIHIIPYQARESMPSLINYADLHFIFMSSETDKHGFPSKVYTIMACKKPLVITSGEDTPIFNFLSDKNCAFMVTTHHEKEKQQQVKEHLLSILNNRNQLTQLGANGYSHIEAKYTKKVVINKYIKLIKSLSN